MISIIICSVDAQALERVRINVRDTVGMEHEIIAIDNSSNRYGICEAYNLGAAGAQYSLLCFMHEDISFDTKNWGDLVRQHLANSETGLIGVAGGDAKSRVPSSWTVPFRSKEIQLMQHYKRAGKEPELIIETNGDRRAAQPAVLLDGMWLCTRRDVFEQFQFDQDLLRGFHGYDQDYSLQVGTKYGLKVVFDVLIRHYSEGNPDKRWVDAARLVNRKWFKQLPVSVYKMNEQEENGYHWKSLQVYIEKLIRLHYPLQEVLGECLRYALGKYFRPRRFLSLLKFMFTFKPSA